MNTFVFDGSWNQIKGLLRQRFAQLGDADLDFIQGKGEELLGRIQTRLGLDRAELEILLDNLKDTVATGAQTVRDKFAQVTAKVTEMAGEQVRRKPREALLTALGVGFVIGLMLRRD